MYETIYEGSDAGRTIEGTQGETIRTTSDISSFQVVLTSIVFSLKRTASLPLKIEWKNGFIGRIRCATEGKCYIC